MFDLIDGLPVHPLVVHAIVVLLPLACLGTLALVLRPAWRERFGILVVAVAAVATVLLPVATSSGESLEERVGDPGSHAELGEQLIWFALPLLVLTATLVYLDRRARGRPTTSSTPLRVVSVLALVVALAATVQVYRVGESGARAAWGDQVAASEGGD
ncbi:MAG TPA: DUF2231 domain-containing protein [Nocardioides sp.]|nr:DUF2231 domain-containing protein [Nocardioides sp.]